MNNPFKYGHEVSGYHFYDRERDCAKLCRRLIDGGSNVVMYAPRRYGKTSLVSKVLGKLSHEHGIKSLLFDLTMVTTLSGFCEQYVNAIYAMIGGRRELMHLLTNHLAALNPQLSVNVAGVVQIKLDIRNALTENSIAEVLDLPERLAEDVGGKPFVVAFDEFQEVAELSAAFALEKIFRSRIQKHRHVRYVFLGSKTHLLERMFMDHSRPFYRSAQEMPLGKPSIEDSREFLRTRFADAGIMIGAAEIEAILALSDNIPYYLQAIAYSVFDAVSDADRTEVSAEDIEAAVTDLTMSGAGYYGAVIAGLSESQRLVVAALARERTAVFDAAYRERFELPTSSTLHSALKELMNDGIVEQTDGVYYLGDPFFVRYLLASPGRIF